MTTFELARLVRHVYELAAAFNVRLIEVEDAQPEQAFAAPLRRTIVVSPIIDETIYAVALHELGHVLSPLGSLHDAKRGADSAQAAHNYTLAEEHAAWDWARHYALDWTAPMQAVRDWAIGTYEQPMPRPTPTPTAATPTPRPTVRVNSDVTAFGASIQWGKK